MVKAGQISDGRVQVWDLPTRLFHWLLAGSFAAAWLSHEHDRYLDIHVFVGYLFFGLLLFRLVWGLIGGRYARFRAFGYRGSAARDYLLATLRGRAQRHLGHNPSGACAIFLMLVLGLAVAATGLLVLGGEERQGPLAGWLSFSTADLFHEVHDALAVIMLALVVVHLIGVAFESWRHRENLVMAMVSGRKRGNGISTRRYAFVGALMLIVASVAAGLQFVGYARATPDKPYLPFTGPALPANATWNSECGSCHQAFHPSLLPARSWEALFEGQSGHFGDDLALDTATVTELREFAWRNAAESALTEAAWKINRSIPAHEAPLRITETEYWKRKHRDIAADVWRMSRVRTKANCAACHLDAERGTFEDAAMRVPASTEPAKPI